MGLLLKNMKPQEMAQICAKALLPLLGDSSGVSVDHGGHKYLVHRDGIRLVVAQADKIPDGTDTVRWDPLDPDSYLGL